MFLTTHLFASKGDTVKVAKIQTDSSSAKYVWILDDKICSDSVYVLTDVSVPKGKREPIAIGVGASVLINIEIENKKVKNEK